MKTYVIVLILVIILTGISGLYAAFNNFGYIAFLMGIMTGSSVFSLKAELKAKTSYK